MTNRQCLLAVAVLLGWFHTGDSIVCYDGCIQTTGDEAAGVPGFGQTCLNKNPVACGVNVSYCYLSTSIVSKPYPYEMKIQRCAPPGEQKAECTPWTARTEGTYSGQYRDCYCAGEKCNVVVKEDANTTHSTTAKATDYSSAQGNNSNAHASLSNFSAEGLQANWFSSFAGTVKALWLIFLSFGLCRVDV